MVKKNNTWSIMAVWNDTLVRERYPVKPRDYISASDIGKPFLDRYLKMKGVEETNPFDERALRVFAAGNEFHHLIYKVLEKIGLVVDKEQFVRMTATKTTLPIIGYYDVRVGGFPNWNVAKERVKEYGFSEAVEARAMALIDYFSEKYPKGLSEVLYDIKSVNSLAFWSKKDYIGVGYPHHQLQLYTYLKATGVKDGRLLYISKDDLTVEEVGVRYPNEKLEEEWRQDVETMTRHFKKNIEPEPESNIVYNEARKAFELNWKIKRSTYLTYMTGMETVEEWEKEHKPTVDRWNRVLKKLKRKENLTDHNFTTIGEMRGRNGKLDKLLDKHTKEIPEQEKLGGEAM